jgi:uncharacterized membrane protein
VKTLPRFASVIAFCLFIVAHLECPDINVTLQRLKRPENYLQSLA